tara:strand:- start:42 stop:563 length:522 start_codon:yes stop_codon:yes gene_type:complete
MATIADMQKYNMLQKIGPMNEGLAMAHPPGQLPPYVPPDKPSSPWPPGKSPAPSRDDKIVNLTPKMFTPFDMNLRDEDDGIINHIITPGVHDSQMEHFKRFIKNTGDSTWDLTRANSPMMIAKGRKKKNKELTIYEEAARRDALKDMANEPYDPRLGEQGGGFDIINDLLDGV